MGIKTLISIFVRAKPSDFFTNLAKYRAIKSSGLFDSEFYKTNYDCKGLNPAVHYLFYGYSENYCPSHEFDAHKYFDKYMAGSSDVSNQNPLLHYLNTGKINEFEAIDEEGPLNQIKAINKKQLTNFELDEPLVSIIILNKNGLHHLKKLFSNFKENTNYSNYEIIIVDNNSTDESVAFLETLDLPIKIIKNNINQSFSKANNEGFKVSNGDLILLMNNDMETTYGWLNELVGTFLNNDFENVGAIGPKLIYPYFISNPEDSYTIQSAGDTFKDLIDCYNPDNNNKYVDAWDDEVNYIKHVVGITGANFLTTREIYEQLGGLNEQYYYCYEDVDFCLKLNNAGYKILYCPKALVVHYESPTRKLDGNLMVNVKRNKEKLNELWGDYLFKHILDDKLEHRHFYTENDLTIAIMSNGENPAINSLNCYDILHEDVETYHFGLDVDIILSFLPEFDPVKVDARQDTLKIAWVLDDDSRWLEQFEYYDYIIYSNKELFDKYSGDNKSFIDLNEDNIAETFKTSIKDYFIEN